MIRILDAAGADARDRCILPGVLYSRISTMLFEATATPVPRPLPAMLSQHVHRPLRIRGVSIDITARKQAEREVQEKRAELTHLSRAAMLGELSGSLAHELNQPLTAILSNAQAAQRFLARPDFDRAEMEEILRDIVEADQHAGQVIRSLRQLLKKGALQRLPLDANEVVQETLKLMRSDLLNHHVAVRTTLAPGLPRVCGDRVQLQQVLLNLVMNASDAHGRDRQRHPPPPRQHPAPRRPRRARLRPRPRARPPGGCAGARLRAVLYHQAAGPRPRPRRLPLDPSGPRRRALRGEPSRGRRRLSFQPARGSQRRAMNAPAPLVCLVDDEAAVRKAVARLLRAAGLEVAPFASPEEFLAAHDPAAPGCLVLDMAMPGLDGLELQQALAARGSALPVIFLTGHADVPMCAQAMKRGATDFLTKPVNDTDLLAAVRRALEHHRRARQTRAEADAIRARIATLTPREREVLEHVVTGQLNKQIASDLGTVEKTIKVHRARVMEKMRVRSVAELVRLVERSGLWSNTQPPRHPAP